MNAPFPLADFFDSSQLLMLAGFIMFGWVLARRSVFRRKRMNQQARESREAMKKLAKTQHAAVPLSDAPVETQRWQVAMFDLQRELKAELDTRIATVQSLVTLADRRIAELRELQSHGAGETGGMPGWSGNATAASSAPRTDGVSLAGPEAAENPASSESPASCESPATSESPASCEGPATPEAETREAILRMSRQKFTAAEIAETLGVPLGQTELILAMHPVEKEE